MSVSTRCVLARRDLPRAAATAEGEALEAALRGDRASAPAAARPGALLRVLVELGLVDARPGDATVTVPPAQRTRAGAVGVVPRRAGILDEGRRWLTAGDSTGGLKAPTTAGRDGERRRVAHARRPPSTHAERARRAPGRARRRSRRPGAPAALRPVRDRRGARRRGGAPDRPRPRRGGVRVRLRAPRRPAPQVGRGLHRAPGRRREDLRGHAPGHRDARAPRCCTTPSRTRPRRWRRCASSFGEEIATLVDGVTKLTGITFQSRDEAQAENYRKMMVAMATDVRVILIKLADRLHNMRTIGAMPKQKQIDKAKETLEIYAPIAHRLGIHAIKWELEDLAFAALHPRKYQEIKGLVNQQREEREDYVATRARGCSASWSALGIQRGDRRARQALLLDLLEDDEEGPRVQRDLRPHGDAGHRRLREGLLRGRGRHPLAVEAAARALQGLHRDAQVQHVPVAAHDGDRARGTAAGDPDPHARDARHGRVRRRRALDLQAGPTAAVGPERRRGEAQVAALDARLAAGASRTPRSSWRP